MLPGFSARLFLALVLLLVPPACGQGASTERVYLSGTDKDHTVPWDFRVSGGRNAGGWSTIPVPSCWETKGFGSYKYGSWAADDEYGEYRRRFDIPAAWAGRRVFLVFEGAMTETETRVNGVPAGASAGSPPALHRGGFYEFSHEITGQIHAGTNNLLEVTVRKTTGDVSVNDAERKGDYWNFGGIYRPVYLESRPASHVERLAIDARHDGQLVADVFLSGIAADVTVVARVTTPEGVPAGPDFQVAAAAGATSVKLSATMAGVKPWSPEFPDLYQFVVEIRDATSGKVIHTHSETIGFRTIRLVPGEGFHLNGKRVRLRGTVHHEFWPDTGRTSSLQQSADDIGLMKSMNMNAVRRAHYPASRGFYQEADRLGILVLDELGGWQHAYGNEAAPGLVRQLVIRDVNHPCVIAWGNGNEGGWNTTVDDDFALWDPQQRAVIHPANWDHAAGGLKTHHYSGHAQIGNYLGAGKTAFMSTENLHGLYDGGGGAGLDDCWEIIRNAPNGAGLFIWSFIDEGLKRDDRGGAIDVAGDAAPDGLLGPYREKEASYSTVRALWSPVQILRPPGPGDTAVAIENRFDFTNLDQCAFRWELGNFPGPADPASVQDAGFLADKSSGNFTGPDIAPGASGSLALGLPEDWQRFDALRLTATDPHGRGIYTWSWPLHPPSDSDEHIVPVVASGPAVKAGREEGEIQVTAGNRVFRFDGTSGQLLGVSVGGKPVSLANGPRPVSGSWTVDSLVTRFDGGDFLVTVNDPAVSENAFEWRVRPDGWLRLKYRYSLTGKQTWLGVTFDYPEEEVTAMRWLGQGPFRVWKNRRAGQETGVYRKTANNTDTGKQWDYPEFRGYHGQLRWATLETKQLPITIVCSTPDLFLRVLSWPDASASKPGVNVARPPGNLSLLHGINGIGHKFGDAASLGPQGGPNLASGLYTGAVDFHFGVLPEASRATGKNPPARRF